MIHCKDCAWFASVGNNPTAKKIHDILNTGNETGVCRKLTFNEDRPALTRPDGYCHRAERREAEEKRILAALILLSLALTLCIRIGGTA